MVAAITAAQAAARRENIRRGREVHQARLAAALAARLTAGSKRCSICHETKPMDEFTRNATQANGDGRHCQCKACRNSRRREWASVKAAAARQAHGQETAPAAAEAARAAEAADRARKAALELKRQLDDAMVEASPAALAAAAARADEAALARRLAERAAALRAERERRTRPVSRCTTPGCVARYASGPDRPCREHAKLDDADMDRARNAARLYGRFVPYEYGGSAPESAA